MAYVVTEHCMKCKYTECTEVCPVEALHEGPDMLYINPTTCIECDACRPACPVGAIYKGNEVPERYQSFIALNASECEKYPTIGKKKDPMPGALTLEQWEAADKAKYGS